MDIDQANKDIQSLKNGVVPSGGISFDTPDQPSADVEGNDTNLTSAAPKIITASAATFFSDGISSPSDGRYFRSDRTGYYTPKRSPGSERYTDSAGYTTSESVPDTAGYPAPKSVPDATGHSASEPVSNAA